MASPFPQPETQLGKRRRLLAKAQNRTFHLLQKGHFNLLRTRLRWQIRPRTVLLSVEKLTTDPKMSASRLRLRVMIGNPLTNSAFRFNGCIISRSAATGFANVQLHTIWYRYKLVFFSWIRRVLLSRRRHVAEVRILVETEVHEFLRVALLNGARN